MARGDPMQIGLAVPIENYRFAKWTDAGELRPVGWHPVPNSSSGMGLYRPGRSALSYLAFSAAAANEGVSTSFGPRSVATLSVSMFAFIRYALGTTGKIQVFMTGTSGGSIGSPWAQIPTSTTWTDGLLGVAPVSGWTSGKLRITSDGISALSLSEAVISYCPYDWGSDGYETITTPVDWGSFYLGPASGGQVVRYAANLSRMLLPDQGAGRLKMEASFRSMPYAEMQTILRYYAASIGQLDGFPHPVAVRHFSGLIAYSSAAMPPVPEYIVGHFADAPRVVANRSGSLFEVSFVIEER